MESSDNNKKRFIISERRVRGEHKLAIGDGGYLCAFCNTRLTVLSNNTYGCFNCNCKYYDYTDSIEEMLDSDENVTMTEISEKLNVDLQYISEYARQRGVDVKKGAARICITCGRVIMDGGECKNCALRVMKRESDYNAMVKARKEALRGKSSGMRYIGHKNNHMKRGT